MKMVRVFLTSAAVALFCQASMATECVIKVEFPTLNSATNQEMAYKVTQTFSFPSYDAYCNGSSGYGSIPDQKATYLDSIAASACSYAQLIEGSNFMFETGNILLRLKGTSTLTLSTINSDGQPFTAKYNYACASGW